MFKIEKREDKKFFEELNAAYENILNYLIEENDNYCGYDLADFIRDHMYDMIVREIDINPFVVFEDGRGAKVVDCLFIKSNYTSDS